jgi:hypothetical protein
MQRIQARSIIRESSPGSRIAATTRAIPESTTPISMEIPVCDDHALSFEDSKHFRSTVSLFSGLLIVLTVIMAFFFVTTSLGSQILNTQLLFLAIFFGLVAFAMYKISSHLL